MSMPRVEDPLDVKYGREIGKAGCFRFFEAVDANGEPSILQCAADPSNVELAARRMRHETSIVSDFRGRSVAPFVYWSESAAIALWHDNGFRPALQRVNLVRDGLDVVLSQLIQISEAIRGLHAVGVVHGALFPYGPWVSEAIDDVRFADCSLAFTLGQGFGTPQPWGLVGDDDLDRLSPEQTGQTLSPLDERTDCYGLGLLIEAIVDKGRGASVIVPEGLRQLVDLMTAGSPEVRPSSVAAVIEELHKMEVTRIARVRIPTDPGAVRTGSAAGDTKPKFRVEPAGRENLIEELRSIWVAPGGRALVIAGQPGIGKTELARLFAKEVELGGGVVTYAKGDPIRQSQPLIALRRVVRQLCAQILLRGPEEADRIRTSVKTALAEECQLLVAAVPEALPLVGVIRETTPIASPLTAQRSMWAISQMISTVADACGGLCIIFDDVQWLDQGSLSVIDGLLAHIERTPITLLMVARATLDQVLPEVAKGLRRIDVESLSCEGVEAILVKSCPGGVARQQDLARQLHTLSGGNPLYVTQILHHMTSRGKLYWDAVRQRWNWQADGFTDLAVSEDILALISGRISALSPDLRRTLHIAASLAEIVSSEELCILLEISREKVEEALTCATELGLITPVEAIDGVAHWRFVHDQVGLAAHRDLPLEKREPLRRFVGLKLLRNLGAAALSGREFTIVECLADCTVDSLTLEDRHDLANLEISVGIDARRRLDFNQAERHLNRASALLPSDPWKQTRAQVARITEEKIYCAYAKDEVEQVDSLLVAALRNSPDPLDAAHFHKLGVVLETQSENYSKALRIASKGLSMLGVRMPLTRSVARIAAVGEFARVGWRLGRRPLQRLDELPLSGDSKQRAAIDLIVSALPAAYLIAPELMIVGGLKVLRLSLLHGRTPATAVGEVLYGLVVSAFFGARSLGFRFGELAVRKAAESRDTVVENQVLLIHAAFVRFWAGRLVDDEPLFHRGYELARQSGDMLFANYHILGLMSHRLARGAQLGELQELIAWGEGLIRRSRDSFCISTIERWRDVVSTLREGAARSDKKPTSLVNQETGANANLTSECYRRVMLCTYCWFAGDVDGAVTAGRSAERISWRSPGHIVLIEHAFYYGLALAASIRCSSSGQFCSRYKLWRLIRRIDRWSRSSPETFLPRLALLKAEYKALNQDLGACHWFEEAARIAEANEMTHIAALSNEGAARFFKQMGSDAAAISYAAKSRDLYARWGASAKVRDLEERYETLGSNSGALPLDSEGARFDRFTIHAAQALLSISDPSDLIHMLLSLASQTCDADVVVYASVVNGAVTIEAEAQGISEPRPVGLPPEIVDAASPKVLHYVAAVGKEVVGSLSLDRRFCGCRRLSKWRPAAVCCIPVLRKEEVFGMIYLEHATNAEAFSRFVVETLRVLAANMTATLERAQMAHALRTRSAELSDSARKVALLEAAKLQFEKFVPDIVRREIEENPHAPSIDARPQDVTVLFLDIAGYTSLNERLTPQDAHDLIEHLFSRLIDVIYRCGGEICETTGDGLLVTFASDEPNAHALDAVRSAIEMRGEVLRFNDSLRPEETHVIVNFGLNSGLGAVGSTRLEGAERSRWVYTVNGQVVNIAARIVAEAKNGQILVGPETARRIRNQIDVRSIGHRKLKGLSVDVELHAAKLETGKPAD